MEGGDTLLADPQSVTYDGSAKSLSRLVRAGPRTVYATTDGLFELTIARIDPPKRNGIARRELMFSRYIPDPTPADVFDDFRRMRNTVGIVIEFDALTRTELSVDLPLLRSALNTYADTALLNRVVAGEG